MTTLRNPHAIDNFDEKLQSAFEANILAALLEDVGTGDLTGMLGPTPASRPASSCVSRPCCAARPGSKA